MNAPDPPPVLDRLATWAGPLPPFDTLPDPYPYETIAPDREGFAQRDGVRLWYGVFGTTGPWLVFAPLNQIAHASTFKAVVPYLSNHFRVLVTDPRGNGRSDRPDSPDAYGFDICFEDFVAVLDAAGVDRATVVAVSASTLPSIRLAAERPERVSHLIVVGGFAEMVTVGTPLERQLRTINERITADWPWYVDWFWGLVFSEPHSTKPFEDGVAFSCGANPPIHRLTRTCWFEVDVRPLAREVRCPTLVIHGDGDTRVAYERGKAVAELIPDARFTTIEGGGHLLVVRDPAAFCRLVRDFADPPRARPRWVRGMARRPRALFVSSPIGLGHVQRDLAIARALRAARPELEVDWFTVDPAATYLTREGERLHPITRRLANESRHFERQAGEHDLQAFFALRTMDEIMARNFLAFADLVEHEHYDIVIGDEAWDVDYHYHENPELKRQPFVFLTDFVGCLPMSDDPREAYLCADRNADDIEHVARYPWIRDRAIFVGNPDDLPDLPFGPGLPNIRDWTRRNFAFSGYTLPFDPASLADVEALRARHGYRMDEKLVIAAVGGTAVGRPLLARIAESFVFMKRREPALRMVLVAGPRLPTDAFPEREGLEVKPYVHNLFEHLACSDLALVQGGLSTCMELVATRRPFLSFPLERHFEQCIHVRHRLNNYCADCAVRFREVSPAELAERALATMAAPVAYRPVETDGAARAAARILEVMENRAWAKA
jgi:pimeloyl-ACP methyl ester carboxylesterase/predicted glycosyltransferase